MSARITVFAIGGPCKGRELIFTSRTLCTVGRSEDCLLRIPGENRNLTVSRRHCLLDIDPPTVWVRDLGSLNGTFVNDRKIGQRKKGTRPWAAVPSDLDGVELDAGDRLVVGDSEFVIDIQDSVPECEPDDDVDSLNEKGPSRAGASSG
jgi:pSer/pThr/pTyr-binding forkhead associated (FHA) protein